MCPQERGPVSTGLGPRRPLVPVGRWAHLPLHASLISSSSSVLALVSSAS